MNIFKKNHNIKFIIDIRTKMSCNLWYALCNNARRELIGLSDDDVTGIAGIEKDGRIQSIRNTTSRCSMVTA